MEWEPVYKIHGYWASKIYITKYIKGTNELDETT